MDTGKVIALTRRMIKKEFEEVGPYHYVGSIASVDLLPTTGNKVGDVYNVGSTLDGGNYAWNGTAWDKLRDSNGSNELTIKYEPSRAYLAHNFELFYASNSDPVSDLNTLEDADDFDLNYNTTTYDPIKKVYNVSSIDNLNRKWLYAIIKIGTVNYYGLYTTPKNEEDLYVGTEFLNNGNTYTLHINTYETGSSDYISSNEDIEVKIKYTGQRTIGNNVASFTFYNYEISINCTQTVTNNILDLNQFKYNTLSDVINHYYPKFKSIKTNDITLAQEITIVGNGTNYIYRFYYYDTPCIQITNLDNTNIPNCICKIDYEDNTTTEIDNIPLNGEILINFLRYGNLIFPYIVKDNNVIAVHSPIYNKPKVSYITLIAKNNTTYTLPIGMNFIIYNTTAYEVFDGNGNRYGYY